MSPAGRTPWRTGGDARGAALILCLLILVALSLLALSAASEHVTQLRMSQNLESRLERRASADHALAQAEMWLLNQPGLARPPPCNTDCTSSDVIRLQGTYGLAPERQDLAWWQQNGNWSDTGAQEGAGELSGPWWIIEEAHVGAISDASSTAKETAHYQILARSAAHAGGQYSVTESIFARPWGHDSLSNNYPVDASSQFFCASIGPATPCGRQAWRWARQ